VKLAMTLLARDEVDVIDAQLAFHLNAGVDFVVATDNGSIDGTAAILERYANTGRLHLLREPADDMRQGEWVTRMARIAATEFGADWVINADADEFWWPRSGSLKDVLESVPDRFGVVRGAWRHFLPRPETEPDFFERMTVRLHRPAGPGDKRTIYHAHQKVAHRARDDVTVAYGNHDATAPTGLRAFRSWYPIEVLHFSFRSQEQFEYKSIQKYEAWLRSPNAGPTLHHVVAYDACMAGNAGDFYGSFVVDESRLERGLRDGTLAVDTRLRDALRALRAPDGSFGLAERGKDDLLAFPPPSAREDAAYVEEIAPLIEIDGLLRGKRRVAELEGRLAALEQAPLGRLGQFLAARRGTGVRAS
jgi:Glycosyl transferase family 2